MSDRKEVQEMIKEYSKIYVMSKRLTGKECGVSDFLSRLLLNHKASFQNCAETPISSQAYIQCNPSRDRIYTGPSRI